MDENVKAQDENDALTQQVPAWEPAPSAQPVWMPSQFNDDSQLTDYARRRKMRRRARNRDDYAGRDFTLGEIIANSVSQGVAAAGALAMLVILAIVALGHGGGMRLVAALLFAVPTFVAFLMSTLYHAIQPESAKRVFKILDQSSTYLLIVGAFAPYCLLTLSGRGGEQVFFILCGIAVAGILVEALWATRPRWIHGILYGAMCVPFLAQIPQLLELLPAPGFWLLAAALVGLAVSLLFRWFSNVHYLRMVFHIVVIAGVVCIFLSVVLFVI